MVDFNKIREELNNELTLDNLAAGYIDPLVKHCIIGVSAHVGELRSFGASREFIESVVKEALDGADLVKGKLG